MFSPSVITSKAAQQDVTNIKAQHADLIGAINTQQLKVADYNNQKNQALADQKMQEHELVQAQMTVSSDAAKTAAQTQKDLLQHQQKMAELDIKRQALAQP